MNAQISIKNLMLVTGFLGVLVAAWFVFGHWVSKETPSGLVASSAPSGPPNISKVDLESDSIRQRPAMLNREASAQVNNAQELGVQTGGLFQHYGDREVLPDIALKDLLNADLAPDEAMEAIKVVHRISRDLTRETYKDNPEVRNSFLTFDEAIALSEQGFMVMKGSDAKSGGGAKFFVCPPSKIDKLNELKLAGQLIYQSPRYVDSAKRHVLQRATEEVGPEGLVLEVRPDGIGIDVRNAEGQPISWTRYNIPGIITGFARPE